MFEQAVEKTIGNYSCAPLLLSLVTLKDEGVAVRFQYYSSNGETVIDLPLSSTKIEGLESSLQNALAEKAPVKLKFKSKNTYVFHFASFNKTRSEYVGGGLAMLFAGFFPVFGIRCSFPHASARGFLLDLKEARYNPAQKHDS